MRMQRFAILGAVLCIALSAPISEPVLAAEPSALLTAAADHAADKAVHTLQIHAAADEGWMAAASASVTRSYPNSDGMTASTSTPASLPVALEGGHASMAVATRGPGDSDTDDDDAAHRPGLIAVIPGDNEATGDGDHEPLRLA